VKPVTSRAQRLDLLRRLYGDGASEVESEIQDLLRRYPQVTAETEAAWDERDCWLITYPDQFQTPGQPPLATLSRFLDKYCAWLNGVHVLPFYPWSSDDGFSITDYDAVDGRYGSWEDIEDLAGSHRLMVDAVINHMSVRSAWFEGFLAGDEEYREFFRTVEPGADLEGVVRPRTTPLLSRFPAHDGDRLVWTTFSADQADLDFRNPRVLLRVVETLLDYAAHGAAAIRLDAIGFLWKLEGTPSIHLPQTHWVIQVLRSCLDDTYPRVQLVSETNVPHTENISYFGDGKVREAQIVYQFPLAPLVFQALLAEDATVLRTWADGLDTAKGTTFLNFLGSHDGVGLRPLEGLVSSETLSALAESCVASGGRVGMRGLPDGTAAPYELNCTWFDLVGAGYTEDEAVARHLATHAVMLALPGIPAIYVHSLFGTPNDQEGFAVSGRPRSLNRLKFSDLDDLELALTDPTDRRRRVLDGLKQMVEWRRSSPAFHPEASSRVLDAAEGVVAVERTAADGSRALVAVNLAGSASSWQAPSDATWHAMGDGGTFDGLVGPWQSVWLRSHRE